jgi:Ca2+/H+ antiporter, TMEM165/GDT1 family
MKRRFWFGKAVMMLVCVAAFVVAFSLLVMNLWNAILPDVLGVKAITFPQALGILVLSKILFGGFGGGWQNKREHFKNKWRQRMTEKWENMTPEERQKFKEQWKNRCGMGKSRFREDFMTDEHDANK